MHTPHPSPRSHRDRAALERRRREAIALIRRGVRPAEVARRLGVTRGAVSQWVTAWRRGGAQALRSRKPPGRSPRLTPGALRRIERTLLRGPAVAGYPTDLWTLDRIAAVIGRTARVRYHPGHVWKVLRKMGWSCQKPERVARERDEAAIQRWVRVTWPRIQKKGSVPVP